MKKCMMKDHVKSMYICMRDGKIRKDKWTNQKDERECVRENNGEREEKRRERERKNDERERWLVAWPLHNKLCDLWYLIVTFSLSLYIPLLLGARHNYVQCLLISSYLILLGSGLVGIGGHDTRFLLSLLLLRVLMLQGSFESWQLFIGHPDDTGHLASITADQEMAGIRVALWRWRGRQLGGRRWDPTRCSSNTLCRKIIATHCLVKAPRPRCKQVIHIPLVICHRRKV